MGVLSGEKKAEIVAEFVRRHDAGERKYLALRALAKEHGVCEASITRWCALVQGKPFVDWPALLQGQWKGRTKRAEFTEAAYKFLLDCYALPETKSIAMAYEATCRVAKLRGWVVPSFKTVERLVLAEASLVRKTTRMSSRRQSDLDWLAQFDVPNMRLPGEDKPKNRRYLRAI